MMIPLVSFESLHEILRKLFDSMLPLCERMTVMASAIACIGALLYISYRVWQSIARAEPIDVFPLLRPFAMCICIIFFNTLVIGGLNGILSPIVKATHSLLQGQTFSMNQYQADKDKLEKEIMLKDPTQAYLVSDEEFDRQIDELGWMPPDLNAMSQLHQDIGLGYAVSLSWLLDGFWKRFSKRLRWLSIRSGHFTLLYWLFWALWSLL